jgi:glycosyltransferase involved in cell wall biosynthesis
VTPFASIIIPTYNRLAYWQDGRLLSSLEQQSDQDFEVLIVDDNSDDETVDWLVDHINDYPNLRVPGKVRLFRCVMPKKRDNQASSVPDNIAIREARGTMVIHTDDDTWLHPELVGWLHSITHTIPTPAVYWGNLIYVNDLFVEMRRDWRTKKYADVYAPGSDTLLLQPEWNLHWGALWAAPLEVLRAIGGHNMEIAEFRGQDARLGSRLKQILPNYYVVHPAMSYWHRGKGWWWVREAKGEIEVLREETRSPSFGYTEPVVVNGGEMLWKSDRLQCYYERRILGPAEVPASAVCVGMTA